MHPLTHVTVCSPSFPTEKVAPSPGHPLAQIHDGKRVFLTHMKKKKDRNKNTSGTGRQGGGSARARETENITIEEVEV